MSAQPIRLAALAGVLAALSLPVLAQVKPAAPGTPGDPVWQRTVVLSDGRTFVTDGGLAIDAAIAKPSALPSTKLAASSARLIEGYMRAPLKDDYSFAQLTANPNGRTFAAPSGMVLNATYVRFLGRILPARSLHFRMDTEQQPIVIVSGGKAIGVLMAVRR
jgi:hypothetical protein